MHGFELGGTSGGYLEIFTGPQKQRLPQMDAVFCFISVFIVLLRTDVGFCSYQISRDLL